jgi:hypothetical protein
MGAWGYGVCDNDTALDLVGDFEGMLCDYSVRVVFDRLKNTWYVNDNWSLLAMSKLQMKYLKKVDNDIYDKTLNVIDDELRLADNWREPMTRQRELLRFKEDLVSCKK